MAPDTDIGPILEQIHRNVLNTGEKVHDIDTRLIRMEARQDHIQDAFEEHVAETKPVIDWRAVANRAVGAIVALVAVTVAVTMFWVIVGQIR